MAEKVTDPNEPEQSLNFESSRREFLQQVTMAGTGLAITPLLKQPISHAQKIFNSTDTDLFQGT